MKEKKLPQYHFQLCELCSLYIKNKDRSVHVLPPYQSHGYSVLRRGERSAFELSREQWEGGGRVGGVFRYYQQRRKQCSGRKGGIKERWRRGLDSAYQMTGLPPAGDDLSRKPLISAQAGGGGWRERGGGFRAAAIRAWLTPTPVHSGCGTGRQTSTDKHRLALTAVRPHFLIWGYSTLVVCALLPLRNTAYLPSARPLMIM